MDTISNRIQRERCMVIAMNKSGFIKELEKQTNRNTKDCIVIADCMDDHFFIGKRNKEKIIADLIEKLEVTDEEADEIYNISCNIITTELKRKLKHPFKSKD